VAFRGQAEIAGGRSFRDEIPSFWNVCPRLVSTVRSPAGSDAMQCRARHPVGRRSFAISTSAWPRRGRSAAGAEGRTSCCANRRSSRSPSGPGFGGRGPDDERDGKFTDAVGEIRKESQRRAVDPMGVVGDEHERRPSSASPTHNQYSPGSISPGGVIDLRVSRRATPAERAPPRPHRRPAPPRRARGPVAGPNRNRRESSPYSGRSPVAVRVVPKSL